MAGSTLAADDLAQKISGRILIQTEKNGEAWYVSPNNLGRYCLGRPADAFDLLRRQGIGITNENLAKFPVGILASEGTDNDPDKDGLATGLEKTLGTNPESNDTDSDGYDDLTEIANGYNPLGLGRLPLDAEFTQKHLGKIFLQVEKAGEAWYVNPLDNKRYFLGRPENAFILMKKLGLGITNENLEKIPIQSHCSQAHDAKDYIAPPEPEHEPEPEEPEEPNRATTTEEACSGPACQSASASMLGAGQAARQNKADELVAYFDPNMEKALRYTLKSLNADSRLLLGNILSSASLQSESSSRATFVKEIQFNQWRRQATFTVEKQENGQWLIMNL
jgi:hypothetical protein